MLSTSFSALATEVIFLKANLTMARLSLKPLKAALKQMVPQCLQDQVQPPLPDL